MINLRDTTVSNTSPYNIKRRRYTSFREYSFVTTQDNEINIVSALISDDYPDIVTITFDRKISKLLPDLSSYSIAGKTILSQSLDGTRTRLTFTLSSPFVDDEVSTFKYVKPLSNPIIGKINGFLDSFVLTLSNYKRLGIMTEDESYYISTEDTTYFLHIEI